MYVKSYRKDFIPKFTTLITIFGKQKLRTENKVQPHINSVNKENGGQIHSHIYKRSV